MKIVDSELKIKNIVNVYRGNIPPSNVVCKSRYSDCFVFVLTGKAEYFFGGKRQTANAGDIIYLANQSKYEIKVTDDNYTFYFVDFFFENESKTVFENEIYSSKSFAVHQSSFKELYDCGKSETSPKKFTVSPLCIKFIIRLFAQAFTPMSPRQTDRKLNELLNTFRKTPKTASYRLPHLAKCAEAARCIFAGFSTKFIISPPLNS